MPHMAVVHPAMIHVTVVHRGTVNALSYFELTRQ